MDQGLQRLDIARRPRIDIVDAGRLIVACGKVEADWPAAATAMITVALPKLGDALQPLLLALELPGVQISGEGRVTLHG